MKKGPSKIDKRTFHCSDCNYNVQVYGEKYFDHGCLNFMETFVCLDCKRLFEGITTKLKDLSTEKGEPFIDHVDVNSIQCLFCGSYNNIKWDSTIGLCPKCGSTMTFEIHGEIRVKHLNPEGDKSLKREINVNHRDKRGLFTINAKDKHNKLVPITHKEDPARVGEPMSDEELYVFAVILVSVYYHYNRGYIKSRNINPGIDYPHIVMRNKDTEKLYYLIVKAGIHPDIPRPLPTENYSTLIKLAKEAKAIPVFIGAVFSNYSSNDNNPPICGGDYVVKITKLKKL